MINISIIINMKVKYNFHVVQRYGMYTIQKMIFAASLHKSRSLVGECTVYWKRKHRIFLCAAASFQHTFAHFAYRIHFPVISLTLRLATGL